MGRHVHFVGVGGYSMSGLAEVLRSRGDRVTGSDMRESTRTERLALRGIPVTIGHRAENQTGADVVVYNTDVPPDNPELTAAEARGARLVHRSDILAEVLAGGRSICVTGTHGKTTTSSLIGHVLVESGLDPTVLVGGEVDAWGGGARIGAGPWIVAEADESDGSFLKYTPDVAVVTNVEPEHLEHYGGSFERVVEAFTQFVGRIRPGGTAVLSADDPRLVHLRVPRGRTSVRYGLGPAASLTAENLRALGGGHAFEVVDGGRRLGEARLPIPGRHNVANALGALGAARAAGIPFDRAAQALGSFQNAHRRFEVHFKGRGLVVIDDYAHHPTEIRAVLEAARELEPARLIACFQPQRYTRTKNLFDGFVESFDQADMVFFLDIYSPPGEAPIDGVSSQELARRVAERGRTGQAVHHVGTPDDLVERAVGMLAPGDLLITLGAGDIFRAAQGIAKGLNRAG